MNSSNPTGPAYEVREITLDLLPVRQQNEIRYPFVEVIEDLLDLQIELVAPSRELMRKGAELAFRYQITSYDSCCLALGESMGVEVLTLDGPLYDRAKDRISACPPSQKE